MEKEVKKRIATLKVSEQHLIQEIAQLDKTVLDRKAALISTRGGIYELNKLLKEEVEEEE